MIWLFGDPRDYDSWAGYGGEEWGYKSCRDVFKGLEHCIGEYPADRGIDGPFPITRASADHELTAAYQEAGKELGLNEVQLNSGDFLDGTGLLEFNIVDDRRMGPAQVLLQPALDRPNLTVLTAPEPKR